MKAFDYACSTDPHQVAAALHVPGTAIVAGGTEILNWMRLGIAAPDRLIDIDGLTGATDVRVDANHLSVGAGVTLNAVGENTQVRQYAHVLAEACLQAASAQVRNRATLGGNVLQKTRCAYFRSEDPLPWPCNKRNAGTGCAARSGSNERHAIFGWMDACVAVQPSDPAVALACLDAEAVVISARGERSVALTQFHFTQEEAASAGGDPAQLETRLGADDVIVRYRIPLRPGSRSAYVKVRERASYEYALVSAAAAVELDGDRIRSARIALGSVAQRPWRLVEAEARLRGMRLARDAIDTALHGAMGAARPLARNGYKIMLAHNAARRALLLAGGLA